MTVAVLLPRTPLLLASSRAPQQEGDVLTTSADPLQAAHPQFASSPSKELVVFA